MSTIAHVLGEPWSSGIGRRALAEVILLGIGGGLLGCWVVLANLGYGAESLSHALLPGLVIAALTGVPLIVGGVAGMALAAAGVAGAGRLPGLDRDAAVAVVVTPLLGLGALLALAPATPPGLGTLLFGDVLGADTGDLAAAATLCAGLAVVLPVAHHRLLAVGLDRTGASALGVSSLRADALLLVLLAAALLVAAPGLGNLLVVAVLVGPAAAARALTDRLPAMMAVAVLIAVLAGVAGLYLSFYASTAAGASIAALLVLAHQAAVLGGGRRQARQS